MKVIFDKILDELREDTATGNGGFGLIADTYANILALKIGKNLQAGWGYVITDRADLGIRLFAERVDATGLSNQLSLAGSGGFLNPDFQNTGDYSGINAFTGIGTYQGNWHSGTITGLAKGDIVKNAGVDNLFYVNLTGTNSSASPDSDTTNWVLIMVGGSSAWGNGFPTPNIWQSTFVTSFATSTNCPNIIVIWNGLHYVLVDATAVDGAAPDLNTLAWMPMANATLIERLSAQKRGYISEWDAIEYDFENDFINKRTDKRNNSVDTNVQFYTAIMPYFQWGNDNVNNNKCINSAIIWCTNNAGVVDGNTVVDFVPFASILQVDNTNTGSVYNNFITNDSVLEISNNIGDVEGNNLVCGSLISVLENLNEINSNFFSGSNMDLDIDTGCSMESNNFLNTAFNISKTGGTQFTGNTMSGYSFDETCNPDVDDINKTYIDGLSTFEAFIDIAHDATNIDLTGMNYVGIFNLASGDATESISDITLPIPLRRNPYKMFPASGLTVTFNGTAIAGIAAGQIALSTSTIIINGTNKDWAEFMPDRDGVGYSLLIAQHLYI